MNPVEFGLLVSHHATKSHQGGSSLLLLFVMARFLTGAEQMRITRKKYDRARAVVEEAREQVKLIKQWDEAIKSVHQPETVDAITFGDDGSTRFEIVHAGTCDAAADDAVQS